MKKLSTDRIEESRPVWEGLEAFARQGVQDLLLAEVAECVTYINGVRVKPRPATTEEKAAA